LRSPTAANSSASPDDASCEVVIVPRSVGSIGTAPEDIATV